ncbi:MAG: hydroxymethylglutaryl-CoA lyase [Verrucomicrobia bacterium]|nr:MAG: hydroxymethylglutaryl-CoA lyase [Verrucomicrobiota bacterium]
MPSESVKLIECPRDAWQGLKHLIPTELKVRYLRALIGAGFRHIDAVSFVSPKAVPQMADSEHVLAKLKPPKTVEIIGIVVNEKGAERAIATGAVSTIGYPCSVSETFLRKNQNQSREENWNVLQRIKARADAANIDLVVYISMAFGNPYGDPWNADELSKAVRRIVDLGIRAISLADTVGMATPELISEIVSAVTNDRSDSEIGVHLHSTPTDARAKLLTAYDAGCRRFDSAIGGLGGCPFAQDALVGNIPTEAVIDALQNRGVAVPAINSLEIAIGINDEIGRDFSL